jgi:UDP-N-acetylmuramoylalanine--D-glutamate ligase
VDHLDWHGSEDSYRSAKARIFANQTESDLLVYDADDPGAVTLVTPARSERFPVSGHHLPAGGGGLDNGRLVIGNVSISVGDLTSDDPIHLVDIAAASALALRMGANPEGVIRAAKSFSAGAHRRFVVLRKGGVTWVDDSKATNPHAALASIRSHDSVLLIAGGLAKGTDITQLAREPNVRHVLGIGTAGPDLVEAAGPRGHLSRTIEEAVVKAAELAEPGDTVLLAPGCASFDQFTSYAARGDRFAQLAWETTGEEEAP